MTPITLAQVRAVLKRAVKLDGKIIPIYSIDQSAIVRLARRLGVLKP